VTAARDRVDDDNHSLSHGFILTGAGLKSSKATAFATDCVSGSRRYNAVEASREPIPVRARRSGHSLRSVAGTGGHNVVIRLTMNLTTDLTRIRRIAREREDENWDFRRWLKGCDIPERTIDATVHRLYREVAGRIDCTACANCCRELTPTLDRRDTRRFARAIGLSEEQLQEHYLTKAEGPGRFRFSLKPCPFLEGNLCRHYDVRPKACAGFPFLHKSDFVGRTVMMLWNYPLCPIVFNVVELLKDELRDASVPRRESVFGG
jgi:hypothetical protein